MRTFIPRAEKKDSFSRGVASALVEFYPTCLISIILLDKNILFHDLVFVGSKKHVFIEPRPCKIIYILKLFIYLLLVYWFFNYFHFLILLFCRPYLYIFKTYIHSSGNGLVEYCSPPLRPAHLGS